MSSSQISYVTRFISKKLKKAGRLLAADIHLAAASIRETIHRFERRSRQHRDTQKTTAITPLSPDNFQIRLEQPNNQDFYSLYAVAKNKPMMLETGAPYPTTGADPAGELPFKMSWAEQIFAERTVARMPLMKMVMWLETTKNNAHVPYNFGIMHTPALLTAFNKLMVPSVVQFSSAALSSMPVKTGASKSHIMGQSSSSPPQMNNSSAGLSRQAAASSAGPSSASASKCPTY